MGINKIVRLFKEGNVCVTGLRGRGKDMLMGNVIARRSKEHYISNINYGYKYIPLDMKALDCGNNTYNDFINGTTKHYTFPYEDGTDVYISDVGIYFPSQYCNELNKQYKNIPIYSALSRQISGNSVHLNVQNLNRCWDKLREMSDTYINCNFCKVLFGRIVIQKVTLYDKYESCLTRQLPFAIKPSLFDKNISKTQINLMKQQYECNHGHIKSMYLIYINKSTYDTRYFKKLLEESPE